MTEIAIDSYDGDAPYAEEVLLPKFLPDSVITSLAIPNRRCDPKPLSPGRLPLTGTHVSC